MVVVVVGMVGMVMVTADAPRRGEARLGSTLFWGLASARTRAGEKRLEEELAARLPSELYTIRVCIEWEKKAVNVKGSWRSDQSAIHNTCPPRFSPAP